MRKAWFTTFAALVSAVGVLASTTEGSPAGMAMSKGRFAKASAAARADRASGDTHRPSTEISAARDPIKYLKAAISEMPIGSSANRRATHPVMPPVRPHDDAISLNKPVGAPTPELLISMAQMSEKQGDIATSRRHYQQALAMWPGNVEVFRAAARMEDRLGDLRLAESLYQQAVAANPQHTGALNDLGLCLARQGKLDASVQVIEQAIQLQPEKALYRNNAATVLVEMRQDQRALGHLAAVHGAPDANYNLGQLLVQRGRATDATPYFQAAVQQNPQMQPAHVALAQLQGKSATNVTAVATTPTPPPAAPIAPATPTAAPAAAPQAAPPIGPQFYYPTTARPPQFAAPGYVPQAYPTTAGQYPTGAQQYNGGAPTRYLPPVANQRNPLRR